MEELISNRVNNRPSIGLIQSRGLGDIIIALPIAKWFYDRGIDIYWPIDKNFYPSFKDTIEYVKFIPFDFEHNIAGFYSTPLKILKKAQCSKVITLYSYLNFLPIYSNKISGSISFDQYKYAISQVPFSEKWNLKIKRNHKREEQLYQNIVRKEKYIVIHKRGSVVNIEVDVPYKYKNHQIINLDNQTECIFDWLKILENAKAAIMINSSFANLLDQLNINCEKYFINKFDSSYTPVLNSYWHRVKLM
jgi:hypothetical protein